VFISVADPGSSAFFLTPGSGILIKGTEEPATSQAGIRPANRGHVGALCEYHHQCFRSGLTVSGSGTRLLLNPDADQDFYGKNFEKLLQEENIIQHR
jgi:hypothetical protein